MPLLAHWVEVSAGAVATRFGRPAGVRDVKVGISATAEGRLAVFEIELCISQAVTTGQTLHRTLRHFSGSELRYVSIPGFHSGWSFLSMWQGGVETKLCVPCVLVLGIY